MGWSDFLYKYRVKEYIWEKIAEGDVHSMQDFDLAKVYCHTCGVSVHQCDCVNSNAE